MPPKIPAYSAKLYKNCVRDYQYIVDILLTLCQPEYRRYALYVRGPQPWPEPTRRRETLNVPVKVDRKTVKYEDQEVDVIDEPFGAIFCPFCGVRHYDIKDFIYLGS